MNRATVLKFPTPDIRSFSIDPTTKEIVLRLYMGDAMPAHMLDVLRALESLVTEVRRGQERAERQVRVDAEVERLRLSGLKHRACIRALFIDPAVSDLHASTADLAHWVKVYGGLR